jgi:hypothetical protein
VTSKPTAWNHRKGAPPGRLFAFHQFVRFAGAARIQETGFDHYYVKPLKLETLLEMLKTVDRQQTVREAGSI